jgi:hypothetical protein
MTCMTAIIFALSIAISGDEVTFDDHGAIRAAAGTGAQSVWVWVGELICSGDWESV